MEENELSVVYLAPKVTSPNYVGVWLESDGERVGPFAEWMVEYLRPTIREGNRFEEVASAIERVLQEAKDD